MKIWQKPNSGYYLRDVPSPDAELTRTDPNTPMGELMRRFWQPVCLASELTDMPIAIRILGEDLVAFRDKGGRIGVLARHCAHRGTSLEYGIISEEGAALLLPRLAVRYRRHRPGNTRRAADQPVEGALHAGRVSGARISRV